MAVDFRPEFLKQTFPSSSSSSCCRLGLLLLSRGNAENDHEFEDDFEFGNNVFEFDFEDDDDSRFALLYFELLLLLLFQEGNLLLELVEANNLMIPRRLNISQFLFPFHAVQSSSSSLMMVLLTTLASTVNLVFLDASSLPSSSSSSSSSSPKIDALAFMIFASLSSSLSSA